MIAFTWANDFYLDIMSYTVTIPLKISSITPLTILSRILLNTGTRPFFSIPKRTLSSAMPPTFSQSDSALISSLITLSKKSPKLVKSSVYPAPASPDISLRSWKMNEFKYYDIPSPFPTLARGLFTLTETEGGEERHRIVVRGYDKFFNIGEVPWTTWTSLESHTTAPYTLSLKSNGCIIFIAALTPAKIVVTSKHSLGPVGNTTLSHAQAGESWLRKYFEKVGKSEEDLAKHLWENNWTAIAELCDDSFEEHVLAYPPEKTGLHLHGLNTCTKDFHTLPHSVVDAFADEWGFIKTLTTTLNTIQEVREFTDAVAKAGEWNGESVEGFVVRTHVTEPPTGKTRTDKSPYAPGSSFFFKVKFDEPYMMYRDWREVTKSLLSPKGAMKESNLPKSKMKRAETKVYVKWVIEEIKKHPEEFKEYAKGKGIIRTREKFLAWLAGEGKAELKAVEEQKEVKEEEGKAKVFGKTVIVPIAIPGCGKTAVSVALAHIFGFGHTQSDDVHVKKAAPIFVKNVISLLQTHDVVIADKNNHLRQHRQSLRESTSKLPTPVRLLALNWSLDKPPATIHRICADRIQSRGANHQTLRADLSTSKSHEDVVWMFINTTEELASSEVDACIEMALEDSLEEAVERAVDGVARILGVPHPGAEKVKEGIEVVKGYEPSSKKPDEPLKKKNAAEARYYGLLPEVDLKELLDAQLKGTEGEKFWDQLKRSGRVTKRPHVTIVHNTELPASKELWDRCAGLHASSSPPLLKGRLGSVVWDGRVMAVSVDDVGVEEGEGMEGEAFVKGLGGDVRGRMHVTVGTRDGKVRPVEAKGLVEKWRKGEAVKSVKLGDVVFRGRVKALN